VFEEMSNGIDHAEVGARLAERWNFPDILVASIRYHHTPLKASGQFRDVVAVIYVANELAGSSSPEYDQIDGRVLRMIGITGREQLEQVHTRLSTQYDREFARLERER
jgi:HD-like signal output (HDOD) protein